MTAQLPADRLPDAPAVVDADAPTIETVEIVAPKADPVAAWFAARPLSPLGFGSGMQTDSTDAPAGEDGYAVPRPQTLAGAVRAAWADARGFFNQTRSPAEHDQLRAALRVCGPLGARVAPDGSVSALLPRPADALRLWPKSERQPYFRHLVPQALDLQHEGCNLPDVGLWPLEADTAAVEDEASGGAPWWACRAVLAWLQCDRKAHLESQALPDPGCVPDLRTHQATDWNSGKAQESTLHQSLRLDGAPMDWTCGRDSAGEFAWLFVAQRAEGAQVLADADPQDLHNRVQRLGRDGASVSFASIQGTAAGSRAKAADGSLRWLPSADPRSAHQGLLRELKALNCGDVLRMLLLTPCPFSQGWLPGWLQPQEDSTGWCGALGGTGPLVRLVAACLDRRSAHSGVSMAHAYRQRQRPARWLAGAGTVYWFELLEPPGENWVESLWLQSVADELQDRLDGWGLAVYGCAPEATERWKRAHAVAEQPRGHLT